MNRLEIKKITMHGFKNHEDLVEFDLGTHTKVAGRNGAGKTTIGEAITWGLLGADLTGNERATTRLVNDKCKDVYVELDFTFNDEPHTVIRRRKGSTTSIFLDDKSVKQADLINFYNNKELFLSIFNPTYFPLLAPKDAKAVLDGVLEEVKKEDVYKELPKSVIESLTKTGFRNPNLYMENQRARAKEITEELQYWNGFKEGKQEDIEIPKVIKFNDKPLKELNKQLEDINKLKVVPLHDTKELLAKQEGLKDEIRDIKSQMSIVSNSKPNITDVSKLSIEVNSLRNQYTDKLKFVKGLDNKVSCPKCETLIDLDADTKNSILEELDTLAVEGKEKADELEKANSLNSKVEAKHEKNKAEQLKELRETITKLELEVGNLNISKLEEENRLSITEQEEVIAEKRNDVLSQMKALEQEQQQVLFNNSQRDDLIKRKEEVEARVNNAIKSIAELETEEVDIKQYIDCAKQFVSKRLEIQAKQIGEHLDKVTIQLEKITQLGEVKPDFKILYDGKEFSILSNSERIKAGLEVANLLMNISNLYIPIFVDNAESITDIPKMDTQLIEARVEAGKELTVEVM